MDLDVEDVVWAKMRGYSYWPAQITVEASSGIFKKGSRSSTKLHVDFLGGEWVPKWIPQSLVRKFEAEDTGPNRKKDYRASARWEDSHLAAMKIGLDKLLQKGGLTIRTETNQDEEFSTAQDSFITQQDTRVTQGESHDKVPTSKGLSVGKNDIVTQTEDSQFYTPEQEFTLASPDQKFFTPRLNLSFPSQAKLQVNPREGRSDIKFSQEEIKLGDGQWSSTPGTTEQPGKGRLAPSKQKKTTKNKEKSVDTTWRRRSRRQIMSPFVREEPDLVSSPQLDADWKVPYKCRLCRTRFGWTADRDSHELICEGELQENVEYGLNYDVNKHSPTERKVAKNGDSTVKVDATTASQSTAKDDLTTTTQFGTIVDLAKGSPVNGKDDLQTSMAENFEVKVVQSSADQKNLQFIDNDFQDMELETELYVGNYAEVEWKTDDSGLEENNQIEECMVKVFDKEADSRKGILESSAGSEESIDMEGNEGNDGSNTSVNTGLKRRIDLEDDEKYDLTMKRRRLSVIEPVSPVRKDKNENETRDHKSDKNLNNASPVTSEMGFQDANYVVKKSDIPGNDLTFLVDNQVLEDAEFVNENMGISSDNIVNAKDSNDNVSLFCNLVIDENCSSEEISLVNAKTTDSYENNDNASEVNSPTIDENSFDENPPINSHRLVSLDHSSVGALVRFENSRNDLESTDVVSSVQSVPLKLARSSHECSHMGSHVEAFEWNDKVFPEKGSFDPPISSTKSYPKMNSLKDEKKIFAKYEDCILPPKVKTKAELKEYGYSRMIEKSNAKLDKVPHEEVKSATGNYDKVKLATKSHDILKSETKNDDKVNSAEKSDDQGKSATKTQDQGKLATLTDDKSATKSHVKVKSAGKSHDKIKSATKSHENVKSAGKSHDKIKSVTKSHENVKLSTKTDYKGKSATKSHDKVKSATKTDDRGKSVTKSEDQIKSATKTDDKGKSATNSQDQGKSRTQAHDKVKLATKTQDQGKSRTQGQDKVKLATKTQDQGKSRTQDHDKVKLATKPQDQGKSRSQTHDKVKLATKIQDKGKLATQTHDKVKSKAVTCDKIKSETQTHYKVKSELETHDKVMSAIQTFSKDKLAAKSHGKEKLSIHNDDKFPAKFPYDGKLPTKTLSDVKLPARTPNDGKLPTKTLNGGKLPAKTPSEGKLTAKIPNDSKLLAKTLIDGKLTAKTPSDEKFPAKSSDEGKLTAKTPNEGNLPKQARDEAKMPRDKEQNHKRQKNVSSIMKSSELSSRHFRDIKASSRDMSSSHSFEEPLKKGDKNFSRYKIEKKDKLLSRNKDNPSVMKNYANSRAASFKTNSSRHGANIRQTIKERCKDSSKTISSRDDEKHAFKATSTNHGANLKDRDKDAFKATSTKDDANFKGESKEDFKRSLKITSAKHDANVKDKKGEHSGYSRRLLDDKYGCNLSKDSKTKRLSQSEQIRLRSPLEEYRKPLLGGGKELKYKKDRYRFDDKSTGVPKCVSRYSSPASSPDAEDKHWKRQKECLTQNCQLKDENPDILNEYKFDKDEKVHSQDNSLYDRGGEQCYKQYTRRDKGEYLQGKKSYELAKNEYQHSNYEYKKDIRFVQTNPTREDLVARSYEEIPEKLRDCQASVEKQETKNGKLSISNEQEMASASNFGNPLSECSEFKDVTAVKAEQEENPACSDKNEEVLTSDFQEHDANKFQNFSYNDTNKLEEFPFWDANDLRELPKYDISASTLNDLPSKNIFDSHCHLDILFHQLVAPHRFTEGYLLAQIKTLSEFKRHYKGELHDKFEGCVTNFCDPKQWNVMQAIPDLIRSLDREDGVYYTVGCHPRHSEYMMSTKSREALEMIVKWGKGKGGKCVAIGECGLDLNHNPYKRNAPFETQRKVFKFQLELAMKLDFPLVLHIRDAEEKAYAVMQEVGLPSDHPIHRHCFNDSWSACQKWMKMFPRSFVGLTNLLLKPGVKHLHEVARLIPLERLILETDSPYFSPRVQNRDFPVDMSHPGDVVHVAALVAALRKDSLENILAANRRNIATLYGIKEKPQANPRQWRVDGRKR